MNWDNRVLSRRRILETGVYTAAAAMLALAATPASAAPDAAIIPKKSSQAQARLSARAGRPQMFQLPHFPRAGLLQSR